MASYESFQPGPHHVGITNAQENNPQATLANLYNRMQQAYQNEKFSEAGKLALQITEFSKPELAMLFHKYCVKIEHLEHETIGIFEGVIEPAYDVLVDGDTKAIVAAANEFCKRHAQKAFLVVQRLKTETHQPDEARLGLTITLNEKISMDIAVEIASLIKDCCLKGATFPLKGRGTIIIYHTDDLGLSEDDFQMYVRMLLYKLKQRYKNLQYQEANYIIISFHSCHDIP